MYRIASIVSIVLVAFLATPVFADTEVVLTGTIHAVPPWEGSVSFFEGIDPYGEPRTEIRGHVALYPEPGSSITCTWLEGDYYYFRMDPDTWIITGAGFEIIGDDVTYKYVYEYTVEFTGGLGLDVRPLYDHITWEDVSLIALAFLNSLKDPSNWPDNFLTWLTEEYDEYALFEWAKYFVIGYKANPASLFEFFEEEYGDGAGLVFSITFVVVILIIFL